MEHRTNTQTPSYLWNSLKCSHLEDLFFDEQTKPAVLDLNCGAPSKPKQNISYLINSQLMLITRALYYMKTLINSRTPSWETLLQTKTLVCQFNNRLVGELLTPCSHEEKKKKHFLWLEIELDLLKKFLISPPPYQMVQIHS